MAQKFRGYSSMREEVWTQPDLNEENEKTHAKIVSCDKNHNN